MEPAADTHPPTCALAQPGTHQAERPARELPGTATAPGYASTYPGRADQLRQVRRDITAYLQDCPAADDLILIADDSLNNQHELEGSGVAPGQGNRANTQGQVGLVLTSSSEEEAGEPFRTGCPLSVALRSRSLSNAVRRSRHSGQSRDSLSRSLSLLICSNVRSSVNRELAANAILHTQSRGASFTVRCQLSSRTAQIEVEDLGGPWRTRQPGDRPHGLDIIAALTGPDAWGSQPAGTGGRTVWATLTW